MEQAIEFTAGLSFLLIGLSGLFRTRDWADWAMRLQRSDNDRALGLGSFVVALSAFIVAGHPVFSGLPMLLTIIGIGGIIEGMLYLFFPSSLSRILGFYAARMEGVVRLFALILILFGAIILFAWWQ